MKSDLRYQFDLTQGSYYQLVQYGHKTAIMYLNNNKIKFIEVVHLPQLEIVKNELRKLRVSADILSHSKMGPKTT